MALEHSTQHLGKAIQVFKEKLCAKYTTSELPREDAPQVKGKAKTTKPDQDKENNMNKQPV